MPLLFPALARADVYGNGSAGTRMIAVNTVLADANQQYTSLTVDAGVTLTVASGTVIRCTGAVRWVLRTAADPADLF